MQRLAPQHLHALSVDVGRPAYDRTALQAGIVHLGIGAFVRGHLAAVNEDAIEATGDMRFGIVGVSLRSADTRDALKPQAGLYALALRDATPDGHARELVRVIGNLLRVMVAPEHPEAVVERIAHEHTRIVSLTITEKGYCHDPASRVLLFEHPDIAHDLANAGRPRSAIGLLVRGLECRRLQGRGPLTSMSLDNLASNGDLLCGLVLEFAARVNADLAGWIASGCTFPNSMVDRIVPRTTAHDIDTLSNRLGLVDAWPVVAEPALEWAVEDRFAADRPRWDMGGAQFVESARAFERVKLRVVNASHSALAYLAASAGVRTVDRAMAIPFMRSYLQRMVDEEIAPVMGPVRGVDLGAFSARTLQRFDNPALAHQTHQIAMDGSQKVPQRLLDSIRERLAQSLPVPMLALAVAGWLRYLEGVDERGQKYEVNDPLAAAMAQHQTQAEGSGGLVSRALDAPHRRVLAALSFTPVFGNLAQSQAFVEAVHLQASSLRNIGVLGTLAAVCGAGTETR